MAFEGPSETHAEDAIPLFRWIRRWLYELRINCQTDFVTYDTLITGHTKISPVDSSCSGHTHVQMAVPIIERLRRSVHIKRHGLRDAMECQITGDLQLPRAGGFNLRRSKRHSWIFLNIKEVIAAKIVVAHLNSRIHGRSLYGHFDGAVLQLSGVIPGSTVQFCERTANSRDAHMSNRELRGRMRRI